MPATTPHVVFRGVSKTFDGVTNVVADLHLEVGRGEFVIFLGPSGSGKTTCLNMLAGFLSVSAGTILVHGRSVEQIPPRKRGIGMVFQNYALFPHLTVAGNLAFPLEVRGVGEARRKKLVRRALEQVRLQGFEDRRPSRLSGGQQQRVAIARALVFEPDLVLMDEPLGALDRRLREELQYEIRGIQRRLGITCIYVTHDQQEAMVLSDRVAVFRAGRLEQVDTPEGLYEEPQRSFVARFVGENNRIRGVVEELERGLCTVRVGSSRIRALRVVPEAAGAPTTVSIRPERIGLAQAPGTYRNEFSARVEDITFLGDHLRMMVSVFGKRDIVLTIPNTVGHGGVLPGDEVRIGWAASDCRALDCEDDEP